MRTAMMLVAAALPLATAGDAAAKELLSAKLCGASECREVKDRSDLMALHEGGAPTDPPEQPSGWFSARLVVRGEGDDRFRFTIALVPEAGLVRGSNDDGTFTWMPVSERALAVHRKLTRGLEPRKPASLAGLDAEPPAARVSEVVVFDDSRPGPADRGSGSSLPWILGALVVLGLAAVGTRRLPPLIRRRTGESPG